MVSITNLGQIKVKVSASVYKTNLRLDCYYLSGWVIRSNVATTSHLVVYYGINIQENSVLIPINTINSGVSIANTMNNKIESFILRKGFIVTFAIEIDGAGKSKNHIASETDLVINAILKDLA